MRDAASQAIERARRVEQDLTAKAREAVEGARERVVTAERRAARVDAALKDALERRQQAETRAGETERELRELRTRLEEAEQKTLEAQRRVEAASAAEGVEVQRVRKEMEKRVRGAAEEARRESEEKIRRLADRAAKESQARARAEAAAALSQEATRLQREAEERARSVHVDELAQRRGAEQAAVGAGGARHVGGRRLRTY
jgi:hypothetical protein